MNIIVVGAGKVGYIVAERLSHDESNNVMVIEQDKLAADKVGKNLNTKLYHDTGSNPRVLREAIRTHNPDVIISTVTRDEDNLFICIMAKSLKPDIKTIARIRDRDYIPSNENEESIAAKLVDDVFTPEITCASTIATLATLENAIEYNVIESLDMAMATFVVKRQNSDIIGKTMLDIDNMPRDLAIVAIYRGDEIYTEVETFELHLGDKISVLGPEESVAEFNTIMGVDRVANEFIILGATPIGVDTAISLEQKGKRNIRILETDPEKCTNTLRNLNHTRIMNGNIVDPHLLANENIGRADVLIVLGPTDEINLLASLMARNYGAKKIIAEYSIPDYESIFDFTGIQCSLGYHRIVSNDITKKLIPDEEALIQMKYDNETFFSLVINEKSSVTGKRIGDVKLPPGCRITHIIDEDGTRLPRMDMMFKAGDKLLMFSYMTKLERIQKMFKATISAV